MSGEIIREKVARVVCEARDQRTKDMVAAMEKLGVPHAEWQRGRVARLMERRQPRWLPLQRPPLLAEEPGNIFRALTPLDEGERVGRSLVDDEMVELGEGALRIEELELVHAGEPLAMNPPSSPGDSAASHGGGMVANMAVLVVIVSRGFGDDVIRTVLEHGLCVPVGTMGFGTGLRDKLGLLRVTIPAQKEIVSLVVPASDAEIVVASMVDELKLDQPGRGFIYATPARRAKLNTRLRVGGQKYAATIEQIIGAVDNLHGGTGWRRRVASDAAPSRIVAGRYFRNWTCLEIVCDDEHSQRFLDLAMSAGAGGATGCQTKMVARNGKFSESPYSVTRSSLVVPEECVEAIVGRVAENGFFETGGHIESIPCPIAFTSS